jgi:hypothetical protein
MARQRDEWARAVLHGRDALEQRRQVLLGEVGRHGEHNGTRISSQQAAPGLGIAGSAWHGHAVRNHRDPFVCQAQVPDDCVPCELGDGDHPLGAPGGGRHQCLGANAHGAAEQLGM